MFHGDPQIKIFRTQKNLQYLSKNEVWTANQTFISANFGSEQIKVFYDFSFKTCFFVYILCTNKKEHVYLKAFEVIYKINDLKKR